MHIISIVETRYIYDLFLITSFHVNLKTKVTQTSVSESILNALFETWVYCNTCTSREKRSSADIPVPINCQIPLFEASMLYSRYSSDICNFISQLWYVLSFYVWKKWRWNKTIPYNRLYSWMWYLSSKQSIQKCLSF